jgi:hypothetical protein
VATAQRDQASASAESSEAYHELIAHSLSFAIRARTLRSAMRTRSGLREGLDVTLGIRPPSDPLQFHDWFAQGFEPINQAWSKIEVVGSAAAVPAATRVLDACADVVGTATQPGTARRKIATAIGGLAWTEQQEQELDAAARRLLDYRRDFIQIARLELGSPALAPEIDEAPEPASSDGHASELTALGEET